MCEAHYRRFLRIGAAAWDAPLRRSPRPRGDFDVWRDVVEHLALDDAGCLVWPWGTFSDGRGQVNVGDGGRQVHRVVFVYFHGPIPDGLQVNHSCGRGHRGCADPRHLYAGTQVENLADAKRHGVQVGRPRRH
jgi:hypothetical protein